MSIRLQTLMVYQHHRAWFCSQEIKGKFSVAFNQSAQVEFEYLGKLYWDGADHQGKKYAYVKKSRFWTSAVE